MISALRWGRWSAPRPGRFTPGKDPVPIVQEAGGAPGPVWTGAEYLAPTGIRSPDRPARNESLYRLSYPGPLHILIPYETYSHNKICFTYFGSFSTFLISQFLTCHYASSEKLLYLCWSVYAGSMVFLITSLWKSFVSFSVELLQKGKLHVTVQFENIRF